MIAELEMTSVNIISFEDAMFEKLLSSAFCNLQNQLFSIRDCYSLSSPNAEKPLSFSKKYFHSSPFHFRCLLLVCEKKKLVVRERNKAMSTIIFVL